MADEIYFVGGRVENFQIINGTWVNTSNNIYFESAMSDCATFLSASTGRILAKLYSETANVLSEVTHTSGRFFVHWYYRTGPRGSGTNGSSVLELVDSNNFPWFRLWESNGTTYSYGWNSGTGASPVWTVLGTYTMPSGSGALETYDLEFEFGTPHTFNVYRNNSLLFSGSFTQASFTNIACVAFGSGGDSKTAISQVMITSEISTIGGKVKTARATGAGNKNQWAGTFASVNEVVGSDVNLQSAASSGLISTHAMTDVTIGAGLEIKTVFHWLRAKNDGAAPNNIKSVLRQGGVDYSTGNLSGVGVGYAPVGARYNVAPDSSNWTESNWNAIEAGYESST
jgi:hypothetical protein